MSVGGRIASAAHAPSKIAEPDGTSGIDRHAETGAEDAATCERRPGRPVPAVGRLPVGLKRQDVITGVWCALDNVVGDPSVSSIVEREISGAANQNAIVTRIVDLDRHRPGIGDLDKWRRI